MKRMIQWMVDNPVSANLLMAFLVAYGLIQILSIKKEVFPEYSLDMISISVPYRGATPSDVEEAVCSRIEEEIAGLDGIKRITSTSTEGLGNVMIEVQNGYNATKLRDDIKSAVDRITNFPKNIEKPVVSEVSRKTEVLKVVLHGNLAEKDLKRYGERIRDDISAVRGISLVTLDAVRPYEISIEVSERMMEKYHLTIPRIASIIQANCQDIPAGKIRQKGEEILVRTKGLKYNRRDYLDIPVIRDKEGAYVRLRDIATIVDGFEETDSATEYDGNRAVLIKVFRIGEQSALNVEQAVKNYLDQEKKLAPAGLHMDITTNMARILRERLDLLITNGMQGFFLVILMLAMFLELRLALWVAFGIPISFFGAFLLLPSFGVSVNMISLFALIICLGMVVDDAIIIGEHVFSKIQSGIPRKVAAVDGAREMTVPVIFSVLTTIAAFLPLLFVSGVFGKFMYAIPVVVISVLAISLVEAIFILPSHLAHLKERKDSRILRALPRYFNGKMTAFIENIYEPTIRTAIRHRGVTVSIGILMFLTTIGYVGSGRMKFLFFPKVDSDQVV
ncbi:MAG: AcrB/AcrD/AcrF family protein, partial [Acidobacteria bacterium CG_4_9_14_3_um_filter_49_7]